MANVLNPKVFEQVQQLFLDEMNYWGEQLRGYTDLVAQETEANLKAAQALMAKGQTNLSEALETSLKRGAALRRDVDARAAALVEKLAELKAA